MTIELPCWATGCGSKVSDGHGKLALVMIVKILGGKSLPTCMAVPLQLCFAVLFFGATDLFHHCAAMGQSF